jgi:hypothetical protein
MIAREQLLQAIKDLPETFSLNDLLDCIMLYQKIEIGLLQSANDKTISTEDAKQRLIT